MSLQFEHADDIPRQQGAPDNFTGTAYFQPVATNEQCQLAASRVTFPKGARTFWHVHSGEQVLYFLQGRGRVQERGSQALDAVEGDVAHIPPGTEHWHGATPKKSTPCSISLSPLDSPPGLSRYQRSSIAQAEGNFDARRDCAP